MKLKKLVAASALVFAGLSSQAMATLTAADQDPMTGGPFVTSTKPVVDLYLTGASAPQAILDGIAASFFGNNTTTQKNFWIIYDNLTTSGGSAYRAYQGRLPAVLGSIPANTMVRITHRAKGGSVFGVNPVADNQSIAFMQMAVNNNNCAAGTDPTTHDYQCGEDGNDLQKLGVPPDFGVSDLEPRMYRDTLNVEFGLTQLKNPEDLTNFPVSGLMFGVVATNGADGVPAGVPAGIDGVPDSINMTKARYHALLSGTIQSWNTLDSTISINPQVVICRRVQGSGAQASYNAHFNNFPCATASIYGTGSTLPLRTDQSAGYDDFTIPGSISIDPTAGPTIIENPSSDNVRDCLTKANAGGIHSFTSDDGRPVTVNFGTGGYRAIGVLSLESALGIQPANTTADWSFRTLNGVAATKENMRTGQYDFWYELSFQYQTKKYENPLSPNALSDNQKALINAFIIRAGDPNILNGLTGPSKEAWVALPLNFMPGELGALQQNTSYVTHSGNSCQTLR